MSLKMSRGCAAAVLAAALSCAAAAAPALKVSESLYVEAAPAAVWKIVGGYGSVHEWHPAVSATKITAGRENRPGAVREIQVKDGSRIVEKLIAYDGRGRSMRYRIVESPFPVRNYAATLSVSPEGRGSRVLWAGQFDAVGEGEDARQKARELFSGIYRSGFDGLKARLGGANPH